MSNIAIKVENISKAYQIGEFSTGTISQDIERWFAKRRGKEDRFLKIGETNDRTTKGKSNIVWSLKDINFEINQGDAVGIIGRNGAGKSTLLKLLSRVTSPTTGNIKAKGRIASLLEVGTGFHPELTGRENIYLNGAILGMRKQEIKRKFDEIVDFSGVERYVDTPVKRYSSGMYVRLAFAVAAHLESEILIVDEVLAVGDMEFQAKCLGKMNDVSKGEGRTVLFVSHNMGSIRALCERCIVLRNGNVFLDSDVEKAVSSYLNNEGKTKDRKVMVSKCKRFQLKQPYWVDKNGNQVKIYDWGADYILRFEFEFFEEVKKINPGITIFHHSGDRIVTSHSLDDLSFGFTKKLLGPVTIDTKLNLGTLAPGKYNVGFGIRDEFEQDAIYYDDEFITLEIEYLQAPKNAASGILWHTTEWRML